MTDYTTIAVQKSTKERIKSHGQKGDTFDQILNKLLDKLEMINK